VICGWWFVKLLMVMGSLKLRGRGGCANAPGGIRDLASAWSGSV
jgi:hypothetical protein